MSANDRVNKAGLQVAVSLAQFIENEVLPDLDLKADAFWSDFARLFADLTPRNRDLLATRQALQARLDQWHIDHKAQPHDPVAYQAFLSEIGYLLPEGEPVSIATKNVDPEIANVPGPQLVVPVTNARFALNAANARWGSLYDGFYGTDALGDLPAKGGLDRERAARVVERVRHFLDETFPVVDGTHAKAEQYCVRDQQLLVNGQALVSPEQFVGYQGGANSPSAVLLRNHGLHVEIQFNVEHPIGRDDPANIADVLLESALSTIIDFEDSVACVDAEDKVMAYRHWLGLMQGNLEETFTKGDKTVTRRLNPDRGYTAADGSTLSLKGRSLLWARNVGHLMSTPAILDADGHEVFEGLMDAVITVLIAKHDLKRQGNSTQGSIYVVKPKMHGPDEVAFASEIMDRVEQMLALSQYTVKLGIMDEERRTSANLKACIRAAKHRVAFINTGFLDRTGDEIHTSIEAGPVPPKALIKREPWISAYECQNVDIGLECGLFGRAQIGKGMWAIPDQMEAMLAQKIEHPKSGANCAWVPSPTAATLHALHYHQVDVKAVQQALARGGRRSELSSLLQIPLSAAKDLSDTVIRDEVENNAQGILGYVVRWIDQGVGCSKVPDTHNVGLMEDRATCRISAQHIANWLHNGIVSEAQVIGAFQKMAQVVDTQNAQDPSYSPMAPAFDGEAFTAALELVLKGREQPSGYTEPLLHAWRQRRKQRA